jgi:hypothetical protein
VNQGNQESSPPQVLERDPVPELARQLSGVVPGSPRDSTRVLHTARKYGGIWGLSLQHRWPRSLAAQESESRGLLSRWISFFRDLFGWTVPRDPQGLTGALARTQEALTRRNLEFLVGLVFPGAHQVPLELAEVSPRGMVWALVAQALIEQQSGALEVAREALQQETLDARANPGDLLCLHRIIENLVRWAGTCATGTSEHSDCPTRQQGGLRTPTFLRVYPALIRQRTRAAQRWARILDALIAASPLTQFIYADVLGQPLSREGLDRLCQLGPEPGGWQELWLAHLARSLVAVLHSPTPSWEDRQRAEQHRLILERRAELWVWACRQRWLFPRNVPVESYPGLVAARREVQTLANRCREEYASRLELLAAGLTGGELGLRALHYRTLDMLVRDHVLACLPAMLADWRNAFARDPFPIASEVLFDEQSTTFDRFVGFLLGCPARQLSQRPLLGAQREALTRLLDPAPILDQPGPGSTETLPAFAKHLGVPEVLVRRLRARFEEESCGVHLPCQPPHETRGGPPRTILANWLESLFRILPPETSAVTRNNS